jgi:hypothetical protein
MSEIRRKAALNDYLYVPVVLERSADVDSSAALNEFRALVDVLTPSRPSFASYKSFHDQILV